MSDPLDQMVDVNVDLDVQEILLAASQHNIPRLRDLIRSNESAENPANAKDLETGITPLHAAIGSCEPDSDSKDAGEDAKQINGEAGPEQDDSRPGSESEVLEAGRKTVNFLLQEGAIWNDLDVNDETPGCLARRLGLNELYELIVDAGVRAEMLLNRLDEYEPIEDDEDDQDAEDQQAEPGSLEAQPSEPHAGEEPQETATEDVTSSRYLQSGLTFQSGRLLDEDQNGVMMAWESDIMTKSAKAILPNPGLKVLNIGHGMGIMDQAIQDLQPASHHIVEAHSEVRDDMKSKGWYDKPGVVVHEGKWQDILPKLMEDGVTFDAIYYDTFAESYSDFRNFFSEHVIGLLDMDGKWSFFNGMGADRQLSYDVYQKVAEMDLLEAGFDVNWEEIKVPSLDGEWSGVRRKYWVVDNYRLPVCKYMD